MKTCIAILCTIACASPAIANDENGKKLGLDEATKTELKNIRAEFKQDMDAIKTTYRNKVSTALADNPKALAKTQERWAKRDARRAERKEMRSEKRAERKEKRAERKANN